MIYGIDHLERSNDVPVQFIVKYLSIWTGIFINRDRWEMSKETGYRGPLAL
jgi:hypothetical protein